MNPSLACQSCVAMLMAGLFALLSAMSHTAAARPRQIQSEGLKQALAVPAGGPGYAP